MYIWIGLCVRYSVKLIAKRCFRNVFILLYRYIKSMYRVNLEYRFGSGLLCSIYDQIGNRGIFSQEKHSKSHFKRMSSKLCISNRFECTYLQ